MRWLHLNILKYVESTNVNQVAQITINNESIKTDHSKPLVTTEQTFCIFVTFCKQLSDIPLLSFSVLTVNKWAWERSHGENGI